MRRTNLFAPLESGDALLALLAQVETAWGLAGLRVFAPDLKTMQSSAIVGDLESRGISLFLLSNATRAKRAMVRRPDANLYLLTDDLICGTIWELSTQYPGIVCKATSGSYGQLFTDLPDLSESVSLELVTANALSSIEFRDDTWSPNLAPLLAELPSLRRKWSHRRAAERAGEALHAVCPQVDEHLIKALTPRIRNLF